MKQFYQITILLLLFTLITEPRPHTASQISKLNNPISVTYSPDGSLVAITSMAVNQLLLNDGIVGQVNGQVSVYHTKKCGVGHRYTPRAVFGLLQPINGIFTPDNRCLITASYGQLLGLPGTVSLYQITPCSLILSDSIQDIMPTAIAVSPDGTLLAIADFSLNSGRILLYGVRDCAFAGKDAPLIISCFGVESLQLAFSPKGDCLAITDISQGTVSLYKIKNNGIQSIQCKKKQTITGICRPHAISFTRDGMSLAVAEYKAGGRVLVYPIDNCKANCASLQTISSFDRPSSLSFSQDGSYLAVGEYSQKNRSSVLLYHIWEGNVINVAHRQKVLSSCRGNGVSSVAFSPSSDCLAIAQENANRTSFISIR